MKATRKLIPALAMLIVAAVVMSTASFAWFTMSRQVVAKGMDVTVSAPNNLLIKATDADDSTYAAETDLALFAKLVPASTATGKAVNELTGGIYSVKDGEALKADSGMLFDSTQLQYAIAAKSAKNVETSTEGGYIDFKYTVKNDGADINVYVKEAKLTFTVGTDEYTITNGVLAKANNESPDLAKTGFMAFRMAIIDGDNAKIYNIGGGNYNKLNTTTDVTTIGAINEIAANPGAATSVAEVTTAKMGGETAARETAFALEEGKAKDIIIRLWLEGQDENCTVVKASGIEAKLDITLADNLYE